MPSVAVTDQMEDVVKAVLGLAMIAADAGRHPTMIHAGVYAAVTHHLKAVVALNGAADGKAVVAKMKALPTDDPVFREWQHP
jgi:hypothetical protein